MNTSPLQLLAQGSLDPHFSENKEYLSPVARFAPTSEGWSMAEGLAKSLNGEDRTEEQPDPSVLKTKICKNCGFKVKYVPNDIKARAYTGPDDVRSYVLCSNCKKEVWVKE
jgi:hypothetical protein